MTIDNEILQTIADALKGIHIEFKNLNQQKAKLTKPEASGSSYGRSEYRPKRTGPGRSGPSKSGTGAYSESRTPRTFKKTDKPPRKLR